nr:LexA family transcriptional regulator [uncultured Pseudomonas sp.]
MDTLGSRITRLRKARGLSQKALGELCGWEGGQARVGNYELDKREPSLSDLRLIAQALGVTLMELLEGGSRVTEAGGSYTTTPTDEEYALVPQYSARGSAGTGQFNEHVEVSGGLVFKRAWLANLGLRERSLHVIYVQGQSMEPTISDGDVVLIDESQMDPKDGRIYAILKADGEVIIKRLVQSFTGGWIVRSDNADKRAFPDQPVSDTDIDHIQIIGRVVWHGGAL